MPAKRRNNNNRWHNATTTSSSFSSFSALKKRLAEDDAGDEQAENDNAVNVKDGNDDDDYCYDDDDDNNNNNNRTTVNFHSVPWPGLIPCFNRPKQEILQEQQSRQHKKIRRVSLFEEEAQNHRYFQPQSQDCDNNIIRPPVGDHEVWKTAAPVIMDQGPMMRDPYSLVSSCQLTRKTSSLSPKQALPRSTLSSALPSNHHNKSMVQLLVSRLSTTSTAMEPTVDWLLELDLEEHVYARWEFVQAQGCPTLIRSMQQQYRQWQQRTRHLQFPPSSSSSLQTSSFLAKCCGLLIDLTYDDDNDNNNYDDTNDDGGGGGDDGLDYIDPTEKPRHTFPKRHVASLAATALRQAGAVTVIQQIMQAFPDDRNIQNYGSGALLNLIPGSSASSASASSVAETTLTTRSTTSATKTGAKAEQTFGLSVSLQGKSKSFWEKRQQSFDDIFQQQSSTARAAVLAEQHDISDGRSSSGFAVSILSQEELDAFEQPPHQHRDADDRHPDNLSMNGLEEEEEIIMDDDDSDLESINANDDDNTRRRLGSALLNESEEYEEIVEEYDEIVEKSVDYDEPEEGDLETILRVMKEHPDDAELQQYVCCYICRYLGRGDNGRRKTGEDSGEAETVLKSTNDGEDIIMVDQDNGDAEHSTNHHRRCCGKAVDKTYCENQRRLYVLGLGAGVLLAQTQQRFSSGCRDHCQYSIDVQQAASNALRCLYS